MQFGRDQDFADTNINLVVNFDLPTSVTSYNHQIGQAKRTGKPTNRRAITLFTTSDYEIVQPIATAIHQAGFAVPEYLLKMTKATKFVN